MTTSSQGGGRPEFGTDRPTALFVAWLFVGLSLAALALFDVVTEGFGDAWPFLLASLLLLWFMLRDWFVRDGGEFVRRNDDRLFLGLTLFVLAITVWSLLGQFVL
ncbi:MAG: hypothetical protein ACI9YT_002227 [Halobacteriales archaeon]|jgi:hypothetical protein